MVESFDVSKMQWLNHPQSWSVEDPAGELEGAGGAVSITPDASQLTLRAPARKDFWSKTFYEPLLVKSDASALLYPVPPAADATVRVDFEYTPVSQFDQAGLLVYRDSAHWMKCGIEYCDGAARLSVVVCNDYSDWSTQPWPSFSARLRVHKLCHSETVVVEACPVGQDSYQFVRIAHLSAHASADGAPTSATGAASVVDGTGAGVGGVAAPGVALPWQVGPYAACPVRQAGCEAVFRNFCVGDKESTVHSSDL